MEKKYLTRQDFASSDWKSWRYHQTNAISTFEELARWVNVTEEERTAIEQTATSYRWRISPYYASLMDKNDPRCPIRMQVIPSRCEMASFLGADEDPAADRDNLKTARVVHKYPNRVAFLVSNVCPVYCRYCTRKLHTCNKEGTYFGEDIDNTYDKDIAYLERSPQITDVLLTGGDPLSLSDKKLESLLQRLRNIPHVEIIRIGSRFPVVLPQRVTPGFARLLKNYKIRWFNTHFNHPREFTSESIEAIENLHSAGITVQNQSVLLNGVNDSLEVMRTLNRFLIKHGIRPYYLYHCDNVRGVSHFRTNVEKGLEIIRGLVGFETGFSVPHYILATALGKIHIAEGNFFWNGEECFVRNYQKKTLNVTSNVIVDNSPC